MTVTIKARRAIDSPAERFNAFEPCTHPRRCVANSGQHRESSVAAANTLWKAGFSEVVVKDLEDSAKQETTFKWTSGGYEFKSASTEPEEFDEKAATEVAYDRYANGGV